MDATYMPTHEILQRKIQNLAMYAGVQGQIVAPVKLPCPPAVSAEMPMILSSDLKQAICSHG